MLKEIFTTKGRLNRLPYLKYTIILMVMMFLTSFVAGILTFVLTGDMELEGILYYVLVFIFNLPFTVGAFMTSIRRLHDLNRSGYFILLGFLPIVNFLLEIYMLFFRGTVGANDYGEDPLN